MAIPRATPAAGQAAPGTISTVAGSVGNGPAHAVSVFPMGRVAYRNGAVYFADFVMNVVRKVDLASGVETVVAGNGSAGSFGGDGAAATAAELNLPEDVAFDAAGNLYIADAANGRVRKVDAAGVITTVAGIGPGGYGGDGGPATQARIGCPESIAFDGAGNLYVSDPCGGNRVRKVDTNGIITTFAGTGNFGYNGDGIAATAANLGNPVGLATDAAGDVYIADRSNNRVRKVDPSGTITTVAGTGTGGYAGDGGPATSAQVFGPNGLALDAAGNLYIADQNNFCVRVVSTAGVISRAAGTCTTPGFAGDGGGATAAKLNDVSGVGFDDAGRLYLAENTNNRLRRVDTQGTIDTIAGNGFAGYSGDGGQAPAAQLREPYDLAFDRNGNLYFTEWIYSELRKVDTTGKISTVVGDGYRGFGCADGPAAQTRFRSPTGIAIDGAGNVYVSDNFNQCIRKVAPDGSVTTVAGTGTAGYNGDNIPAKQAQLHDPEDLAVDAAGNLYVADFNNNRVRKIDASGTITTVAGNGTAGALGDGLPAILAQLNGPAGLAFDSKGNLYIADDYNFKIRKVDTQGFISTVAGVGTAGYGGDGGAATLAQLNFPVGVAVDAKDNLYIADSLNNRIRKVDAGGTITTVAGTGSRGFGGDGAPATGAKLASPFHIAFDAAGDLYFTDRYNNRVRRIVQPGSPTAVGLRSFTRSRPAGAEVRRAAARRIARHRLP